MCPPRLRLAAVHGTRYVAGAGTGPAATQVRNPPSGEVR